MDWRVSCKHHVWIHVSAKLTWRQNIQTDGFGHFSPMYFCNARTIFWCLSVHPGALQPAIPVMLAQLETETLWAGEPPLGDGTGEVPRLMHMQKADAIDPTEECQDSCVCLVREGDRVLLEPSLMLNTTHLSPALLYLHNYNSTRYRLDKMNEGDSLLTKRYYYCSYCSWDFDFPLLT